MYENNTHYYLLTCFLLFLSIAQPRKPQSSIKKRLKSTTPNMSKNYANI